VHEVEKVVRARELQSVVDLERLGDDLRSTRDRVAELALPEANLCDSELELEPKPVAQSTLGQLRRLP
jgi:hypothetical protein